MAPMAVGKAYPQLPQLIAANIDWGLSKLR